MEYEEKRWGTDPIPGGFQNLLNEEQIDVFRGVQSNGWHIKFIRRPLFQRPVCVLTNSEETIFAVLEESGTLNKHPDIQIRSS